MTSRIAIQSVKALRTPTSYRNVGVVSRIPVANYSIVGKTKDVLLKANKKIGEAAAEGINKAEKVTPSGSATEKVAGAADTVNKKSGKVLADGIDKVDALATKERRRVEKNTKGYKDLQDKGSKAEIEQNRPDDFY